MDGESIISVVKEYLENKQDSYALMITGEWGCGKTYFVEHALTEELKEGGDSKHSVIVASAYGVKNASELCGAIEAGIITKLAIGSTGGEKKSRKDSFVESARDAGVSFIGKNIKYLERKIGFDLQMSPLNLVNLLVGPESLLVIDDVERCSMNPQELFGVIDRLVVAYGKKVVLVCNEEEWRKRQDAEKEYAQLIEKTVWRKCRFEPSVGDVVKRAVGDEVRGMYQEATEDIVLVMEENDLSNFRSLCKMRPMLAGMRKSGFFVETADKESARAIFRDVCGYAARAAKGECFDSPSDREDPCLDVNIFEPSRLSLGRAALDFIPRFFERHEGVDVDHVRSCLEDYAATLYPEGPAARKASECIRRIESILFLDSEVPELVAAIVDGVAPADGSRGLSFDAYPATLHVVHALAKNFDDALPEGVTPLVRAMKAAIDCDPEPAVESISNNRIEWQDFPFDPGYGDDTSQLEEIDELREHAWAVRCKQESSSLNNVLRNAPDQFADKLYLIFFDKMNSREAASSLVSLDVAQFADAMGEMSPDKIRLITDVFLSLNGSKAPQLSLLDDQGKAALSSWAKRLKVEIGKLEHGEHCEYYQKRYFGAISRSLDRLGNL